MPPLLHHAIKFSSLAAWYDGADKEPVLPVLEQ